MMAGAGVWLSCSFVHNLNLLAKKGDEHAWVELLTSSVVGPAGSTAESVLIIKISSWDKTKLKCQWTSV